MKLFKLYLQLDAERTPLGQYPQTRRWTMTPRLIALSSVLLSVLINISNTTWARPIVSVELNSNALQEFAREPIIASTEPFYRSGEISAEGVSLDTVLRTRFPADLYKHPERYLISFVCSDGYRSTYPVSAIASGYGVIAERLLGWSPRAGEARRERSRDLAPWPKRYGKDTTAGPYYLLWRGERYDERRPWPYQLTRIDLLAKTHLDALKPDPSAGVAAGHALFLTHCKSCHAINLIGGRIGPELNVPRNILSYRDEAQLLKFIEHPQRFRFRSPMPRSGLKRPQIQHIVDYLRAMGDRRVCESVESCEALVAKSEGGAQ